jgi:hypothetical protein
LYVKRFSSQKNSTKNNPHPSQKNFHRKLLPHWSEKSAKNNSHPGQKIQEKTPTKIRNIQQKITPTPFRKIQHNEAPHPEFLIFCTIVEETIL